MAMRVSHIVILVMVVGSTLVGCKSPKVIDAMSIAAVCDSTLPALDTSVHRPMLPILEPSAKFAAVIGTMEEAGSTRPLRNGAIDVTSAASGNRITGESGVPTDSLGGFALDSIAPGKYVVEARHIGYLPLERRVTLEAGRVDTLRFAIRRHSCIGY
jgi:hypothetical protein